MADDDSDVDGSDPRRPDREDRRNIQMRFWDEDKFRKARPVLINFFNTTNDGRDSGNADNTESDNSNITGSSPISDRKTVPETENVFDDTATNNGPVFKPDITSFPFNAMGKMFFEAADGTLNTCTAQFTERGDIVTTAAHCVFDNNKQVYTKNRVLLIEFKQGSYSNYYGLGTCQVLDMWKQGGSLRTQGYPHDVAACKISDDRTHSVFLTADYDAYLTQSSINSVTSAGYGVDYSSDIMHAVTRQVDISDSQWRMSAALGSGSSGGAWMTSSATNHTIIGVTSNRVVGQDVSRAATFNAMVRNLVRNVSGLPSVESEELLDLVDRRSQTFFWVSLLSLPALVGVIIIVLIRAFTASKPFVWSVLLLFYLSANLADSATRFYVAFLKRRDSSSLGSLWGETKLGSSTLQNIQEPSTPCELSFQYGIMFNTMLMLTLAVLAIYAAYFYKFVRPNIKTEKQIEKMRRDKKKEESKNRERNRADASVRENATGSDTNNSTNNNSASAAEDKTHFELNRAVTLAELRKPGLLSSLLCLVIIALVVAMCFFLAFQVAPTYTPAIASNAMPWCWHAEANGNLLMLWVTSYLGETALLLVLLVTACTGVKVPAWIYAVTLWFVSLRGVEYYIYQVVGQGGVIGVVGSFHTTDSAGGIGALVLVILFASKGFISTLFFCLGTSSSSHGFTLSCCSNDEKAANVKQQGDSSQSQNPLSNPDAVVSRRAVLEEIAFIDGESQVAETTMSTTAGSTTALIRRSAAEAAPTNNTFGREAEGVTTEFGDSAGANLYDQPIPPTRPTAASSRYRNHTDQGINPPQDDTDTAELDTTGGTGGLFAPFTASVMDQLQDAIPVMGVVVTRSMVRREQEALQLIAREAQHENNQLQPQELDANISRTAPYPHYHDGEEGNQHLQNTGVVSVPVVAFESSRPELLQRSMAHNYYY